MDPVFVPRTPFVFSNADISATWELVLESQYSPLNIYTRMDIQAGNYLYTTYK